MAPVNIFRNMEEREAWVTVNGDEMAAGPSGSEQGNIDGKKAVLDEAAATKEQTGHIVGGDSGV